MKFLAEQTQKNDDKEQVAAAPNDSIQPLDDDDYQEIEKINEMLNPNEAVIMVAQQSRVYQVAHILHQISYTQRTDG